MNRRALLAATALLAVATPASAQVVNPLAMTTDPADRAVMTEAMAAMAAAPPDLARLDAALAKLPRPTPLRAMVQTGRAQALARANRNGDAVAAIEEALRLLPGHPAPKLTASYIFIWTGSPQRAADLWMQASVIAPEMARSMDRYAMMALQGRLRDVGDEVRADKLSARMGEIGFASGLAPERSQMALARVRTAMAAGRTDDALTAVTAIGGPGDMLSLYVDRRYEALWPRIAEWAGPGLALQSRRYLEELRGDWIAADDFETATPYARRLAGYRAHATVVALFLPMFDRVGPDRVPDGVDFLLPAVTRALAAVGREADALTLLARVASVIPKDQSGRDLNVSGASITLDATAERWAAVLPGAEAFLARATALGPAINSSATATVRSFRACALWKTGKRAEAEPIMAELMLRQALNPDAAQRVLLCRGDAGALRDLRISRLESETTRDWALASMQPTSLKPVTALDRADQPLLDALRRDPAVLAVANRVGRILPQPTDVLPAGFDPFAARPAARLPKPGEV